MTVVAGFDLKEFDSMMQKFENLKDKSIKHGKKIINEAAQIVLEQQRVDAPRDSGKGAENLKVTEVKLYKTAVYAKIGINSKNWEVTKGLWYQHFGYHNNGLGGRFGGKFVATHAGWMNTSFDKCKHRAYDVIYSQLRSIDLKL